TEKFYCRSHVGRTPSKTTCANCWTVFPVPWKRRPPTIRSSSSVVVNMTSLCYPALGSVTVRSSGCRLVLNTASQKQGWRRVVLGPLHPATAGGLYGMCSVPADGYGV